MTTTYHLHLEISGALRLSPRAFRRTWEGVVKNAEGRTLTCQEFYAHLLSLDAQGHKLMRMDSACDGFDPFEKGCPGHPGKPE
jgi:hypothetical protein